MTLVLAPEFNGLAKTLVFRNGTVMADIALVGDATTSAVPVNVLGTTGHLDIGIYAADGDGNIVIPTVWAFAGLIVPGVVTSGVSPSDPVPNWVAQVQAMASEAVETANEAKDIAEHAVIPVITTEAIVGGTQVNISYNGEVVSFDVMDGVSISGTELNEDYTLTIYFSNGESYTTPSIRGAQGEQGPVGPTPAFSVGTVSTLQPTDPATATITGTDAAPVLNLGIPQGVPGEVTETELAEVERIALGAYPQDTASGAIASFPDGADDIPILSIVCSISPVQSLNGYDAPWPAGGGKNLCPTASITTGGTGGISSSSIGNYSASIEYTLSFDVLETNLKQVRLIANGVDVYAWAVGTLASGNRYTYTFTLETDAAVGFQANTEAFNANTKVFDNIQVEVGPTATSYAPYSNICPISGWSWDVKAYVSPTENVGDAEIYTATIPTSPGTVYGAQLDLVSGVLTVDKVSVSFADVTWSKWTDSQTGKYGFYFTPSDSKTTGTGGDADFICSMFKPVSTASRTNFIRNGADKTMCHVATSKAFYVIDNDYTDKDTFAAAVSTGQIVYDLATPLTYQLTPQEISTLVGQNNVWQTSGDNVSVRYRADTALYIAKKLGA